jgi:hypothetical protein
MSYSSAPDAYEFDVAVSFAGEDREFVEEIVNQIKATGLRVFYDSDYSSDMWGEELTEYLDEIYRVRSRYAVIFISKFYAAKMWTNYERRSVLARALEDASVYMLPVRLDDTTLPGLRPTIGYLDARQVGLAGIVQAILAKLGTTRPAQISTITRVPRTEVERQQLLLDRPRGWEYLYFAAQLLHERSALENKYRDYLMDYAPPTGEIISFEDAPDYMARAALYAIQLGENLTRVMSSEAQERAFGRPGEEGDPEAIAHLAMRMNSLYKELMDWAAKVRGAIMPPEFRRASDVLASFNRSPISAYREFVDDLVERNDRLPAQIAAGEPVQIHMTLKFAIPEETTAAYKAELDRIAENFRKQMLSDEK